MTVSGDSSLHPVGKGIYTAYTYTVESSGNLIGPFVELSAGMEPGKNQLKGTYSFGWVHVHRNTPPVILNPDNIVILQSHSYL